jgi:hypothetical protein
MARRIYDAHAPIKRKGAAGKEERGHCRAGQ